jgi:hypothetical protein
MDNIVQTLSDISSSYGFWGCVAVIVIMAASQGIKIPLKNWAESWSAKAGVDKKAITAYFVFIPVAVSLAVSLVLYLWRSLGWDVSQFDWGFYLGLSSVLSAASVSLYEAIDGFVKMKLAKEQKALSVATGSAEVAAMKPAEVAKAYSTYKATVRAAKKEAKAKAKAERAEAAKAEEAKSVEQEIEAEEAKLAALKAKAGGASADAKPSNGMVTLR